MKTALGLAGFMFFAFTAKAILLFNDSFNYPDGPLVVVSSNVWVNHSGSSSEAMVASGRLLLSDANTEDVHALLPGQPYPAAGATNIFYTSFRVRFTTPPGSGGAYFGHFKDSGNGFRGRVWAFQGGAPYGKFRMGISSTDSSAATATNVIDLSLDTDYTVVTRLVNTNSAGTLWINPTAETDPSASASEGASSFAVAGYAFRESAGEGDLSVDHLRIGTTFSDVVGPAIDPPMIVAGPRHQTVTNDADALFNVTASGVPTLRYQWQFNGTNIPGATDSNLVLTHVNFDEAGVYSVVVSNDAGSANSDVAALNVWCGLPPLFSYLTYNVHGNGLTNWSTNMWRIQAIGRQIQYLDPDIITFQEIPVTNNCTAQLADFVAAYRPGFYLATNSMDDGYIHSAILSRYPIIASRSWLHGIDLAPFGYAGTNPPSSFSRDLFEAVVAVPDFPQPLHAFTVHLKASRDAVSAAKRAAEASAVSNFFATVYLPTHGDELCILSGDMNEDVLQPISGNLRLIQRLANASTGLRVTTPLNPVTDSELTWSVQDTNFGPTLRYDYILPCAALFSNITIGQVFRTDLLTPLPPHLYSNDDKIASDHLPVFMAFANPFNGPFRLLSVAMTNQTVSLTWESQSNRSYSVEVSFDLAVWAPLATNLTSTGVQTTFRTNVPGATCFFRVRCIR